MPRITKHASNVIVSSRTVLENVTNLKQNLLKVVEALDVAPDDKAFVNSMSTFIGHATPVVDQIVKSAAQLETEIVAVLKYFAEDANVTQIEDICSTVQTFVDMAERAQEDNLALSGGHILRSKTSHTYASSQRQNQSFDGTLKAIRSGRQTISRSSRTRIPSHSLAAPFRV